MHTAYCALNRWGQGGLLDNPRPSWSYTVVGEQHTGRSGRTGYKFTVDSTRYRYFARIDISPIVGYDRGQKNNSGVVNAAS